MGDWTYDDRRVFRTNPIESCMNVRLFDFMQQADLLELSLSLVIFFLCFSLDPFRVCLHEKDGV